LAVLPTGKKGSIDAVTVIYPALQKVSAFCNTSSPPLEML